MPVQLPRPVTRSKPVSALAPLFPDVMSRYVMLQPPPEPLQPVSLEKLLPLKLSVVPPTEITLRDDDGYSAGSPASPDETNALPAAKCESYDVSPENSDAPQLFET